MDLSKKETLTLLGVTLLAVALGTAAAAMLGPYPDPSRSRYFGYSLWGGVLAATAYVLYLVYRRAYSASRPSFDTGSFQGIGTAMYGMRDFSTDESYVATVWLVVLFIPIVPIYSARVQLLTRSGLMTSYRVTDRMRPVGIQVASTYACALLCATALCAFFMLLTEKSASLAIALLLAAAFVVIGLPSFLRRKGRRAAKS